MPLEGVLPVSLLHLFTEPDIEDTKTIKQESHFWGEEGEKWIESRKFHRINRVVKGRFTMAHKGQAAN